MLNRRDFALEYEIRKCLPRMRVGEDQVQIVREEDAVFFCFGFAELFFFFTQNISFLRCVGVSVCKCMSWPELTKFASGKLVAHFID